ncbi:DUF2514 family protein [Pseudomonas moorei]|uniref:DUF2514 family protein n=1 Tax=Pseudomonas moorei TaxID=395599 RepID=UPI00200F08FC|nr:DUF2514 family protein [Pseudomonas moorei]
MTSIWLRILPYIAVALLVAGALFGTYYHGVTLTDARWQAEWNARDSRDAQAKASNEVAERTKERAYQQSINKAVQDDQRLIDQAIADTSTARASANSLRGAAGARAARLAASEASGNSCAVAASKAASHAAMVLADVLKCTDQRAGDLAEAADQARARGVTCEQSYLSLEVNQHADSD